MNKKLIFPIIVTILAVLAVFAYVKYGKNEEISSNIDTSDWLTYRNEEYGFELKYPKYIDADYSANRCYIGKINDLVSLEIFKDNNSFYVRGKYYYEKDSNNLCQKIEETLSDIKTNSFSKVWKIDIVNNIKNDDDINNFIKDKYGEGCLSYNKKKINDFTYEIEISSIDEKGHTGINTQCIISSTKILYNSLQSKIAAWEMGQDCFFAFNENKDDLDFTKKNVSYKCLDEFISFIFTK